MAEPIQTSPRGDAVSIAGLIQRGWTRAAIERFLGEPDRVEPNPLFRNGAPMRLYLTARAEAAEHTTEFAAWRSESARRSATARAKALVRAEEHRRITAGLIVRLDVDDPCDLFARAVEDRRIARRRAFDLIHGQVLSEIARIYPGLATECERQAVRTTLRRR
jgi:hypothetical protein